MVFRLDPRLAVRHYPLVVFPPEAWGRRSGPTLLPLSCAALALVALTLGCERVLAPRDVSYLAIVALIDAPTGISPGARYTYHVRELSGTLGIDTLINVAPTDTIALPLPAATYQVTLDGFPVSCASRYGTESYATVDEGAYTTLVRYYISCRPPLTVHVLSEGTNVDPEIVYRLIAPDGAERLGTVAATDTLQLDDLAPGRYELHLHLLAPNCVVTSDGGARRNVEVVPGGGTIADIHVECSDEARRPVLLDFRAAYGSGASVFRFRATDPDRDIERYTWDITDCRGTSVLPNGRRLRRGLSSGRTTGEDTITVVAAFELGLPDSDLAGRCTSIRVADEPGNTTPVVEVPIYQSVTTAAPSATAFNAVYVGTQAVRTTLAVSDPQGDFVGVFVAARLRDGILGPPDGNSDIGIYNVAGYLQATLPDLPMSSRIQYGDVLGVIVYLVDAAGNFARLEDVDVFR